MTQSQRISVLVVQLSTFRFKDASVHLKMVVQALEGVHLVAGAEGTVTFIATAVEHPPYP